MQNDWESKFYKEVAKIKGIKEEIKKIRSSHKKLTDPLLDTQRILARFMILHDTNYCTGIVRRQKPEIANDFSNQLMVDASRTRLAIRTSQDPFSIYAEFKNAIHERFKNEKIKIVDLG